MPHFLCADRQWATQNCDQGMRELSVLCFYATSPSSLEMSYYTNPFARHP